MLGNLLVDDFGPDAFDINTHLATACDGIQGQAVRVGNVEAQGHSTHVSGECRFAMKTIGKAQMLWLLSQVAPQKHPEQPARHHKVRTVFLKDITLRPLTLIGRQRLPQAPHLRLRQV